MLASARAATVNVSVPLGHRELSKGQVWWQWAGQGSAGWSCALGSHGEEGKGLGAPCEEDEQDNSG